MVRMTAEEFQAMMARRNAAAPAAAIHTRSGRRTGHATAQPTVLDGIRFQSKMEARVYQRLKLEAREHGATLYRQVRMPLFSLAPDERGRPSYLTVDFLLIYPDKSRRFIDAKAKRWRSRDWRRGKLAFKATYGLAIEECDQ